MANRDTSTWYAVEPAQTVIIGAPNRIRTGVIRVKGGYPRPLDDGSSIVVGVDGVEPPATTMSTLCSTPELHTRARGQLEAWEGIEPPWVDLQSTAWPLRHQALAVIDVRLRW